MAGFSSLDDQLNEETTNGKRQRVPFNRIVVTGATSVAYRWHECMSGAGTGGSAVLTGTAGLGTAITGATTGALPQTSLSVSPDIKNLKAMWVNGNAATQVPGIAMLIDLLYIYPSCVVTGTPTTLSNAAGKPSRFNNGVGVQAGCIVVGAVGAAQPILTMSYTDQSGNAGATGYFAASANSQPVGSLFTASAAAGILSGPFMNLAAGDSGVRSLDSYTLASGTTGTVTFFLYRVIGTVPIVGANIPGERDFQNQFPAFEKVDDDAFLGLLMTPGGALVANTVLSGELIMSWG